MSNTFAIKEVLDFTVESYSATGRGDILFTVDYATQTNISTTAERLPIRGGIGNYKILDMDHTKDCMFNATLPIVDIHALAVKLGKDVETGATTAPKNEFLTVDATNKVTLSETPLTGTLKVYKVENERDLGAEQVVTNETLAANKYTISGKEITFHADTMPKDSMAFVSYSYTTGAKADKLVITAGDFPQFIRITGKGIVTDDQDGKLVPVAFDVKKAKVQPGFELTMASDTATTVEFNCDCYTIKDGNDRIYVDIIKLNDEVEE